MKAELAMRSLALAGYHVVVAQTNRQYHTVFLNKRTFIYNHVQLAVNIYFTFKLSAQMIPACSIVANHHSSSKIVTILMSRIV